MTEDLDKELGDLDLDNLDLDDAGGDAGMDLGDDDAAAAPDEGGEDAISLDDDLQSMLDDAPGGDAAAGGGDDDILGSGGDDDILGGGGGDASEAEPAGGVALSARELVPNLGDDQTVNLEFLLDIKLHVTFEVGRSKMLISDLLTLGQGSVIELHRLVGDELDLLVNGKLIAKGEVVVINEKFGCKISDIVAPEDRIKHMGSI